MSRIFLLYRRDPKHAAQVAEACARFAERTKRQPQMLGVHPGTQPPAGADGLVVVDDVGCQRGLFWVGCDTDERKHRRAG